MGEEYSKSRKHVKYYPFMNGWERLCGDIKGQTGTWYNREFTNSLTGEKNPHWRQQIAKKYNACTPLLAYSHHYSYRPWHMEGTCTYVQTNPPTPCHEITGRRWSYGTVAPYVLHVQDKSHYDRYIVTQETQANNIALEKLVKKIRRKQTTFQGGTFAGELRETVSMLRNPLRGLRHGLRDYLGKLKKDSRKLRKLPPKAKRKAVGDTWLEYSFGLSPLLGDIDDMAQAVADAAYRTDEGKQIVTAVGEYETVRLRRYVLPTANSAPYYDVQMDTHYKCLVKYQAMIDPGTFGLSSMRRVGFDPSNWLPTLWELVPWSFLVDYFTNVGEIVSAATLSRASIAWINKTIVKSFVYESSNHEPVWHGDLGLVVTDAKGKARMVNRQVRRIPNYSGTLIPDFQVSLPDFGMKWANMAALGATSRDISRLIR